MHNNNSSKRQTQLSDARTQQQSFSLCFFLLLFQWLNEFAVHSCQTVFVCSRAMWLWVCDECLIVNHLIKFLLIWFSVYEYKMLTSTLHVKTWHNDTRLEISVAQCDNGTEIEIKWIWGKQFSQLNIMLGFIWKWKKSANELTKKLRFFLCKNKFN